MEHIIRSIRRYVGPYYGGTHRVVIIAVYRGEERLERDEDIGALRSDDRLEFLPAIADGLSWVTGDARPSDLGPSAGIYEGELRMRRMFGGPR